MDMQKERAEFESVFPCSVGTSLNEHGHYESQINQQDAMIQNISWVVWQAAKARAVPEGYKIVKQPKPLIGNDAVDFSQSPSWAKYWLMDLGGKCWWSNVRPSFDNDLGCFVFPHNNKAEQAPSFGFSGNFKKSMTSRKAMIKAAQENNDGLF